MKTLRSRLRRHLSYANVMATIAVFVAFGGVSYAAATISGNKLINGTVGAGKLKNGTLTSTQVKADSLTGSVIDESTLATVPSAQTATSAATAATAGSANTAKSAGTALTAENADTVEGLSAKQLQVSCPAATELFGGMCWDIPERPLRNWILASKSCGEAGGRLPSLSELVAYTLRDGIQLNGEHWSGEVSDLGPGSEEVAFTRTETASSTTPALTGNLSYRCLFYRVN